MKLKTTLLSTVAVATIGLAGCASKPYEIEAARVSSVPYQKLQCNELHAEAQKSITRSYELTGIIDEKASDDSAYMAVGMILFWPALFALDGDGEETAEYSRVRGEINAMEEVAILNDCKDVTVAINNYRSEEKILMAELKAKRTQQKDDDE